MICFSINVLIKAITGIITLSWEISRNFN